MSLAQARLIHELFEYRAAQVTTKTAIIAGNQELTFLTVNHRSNQLARYLVSLGVGPNCRVAILAERSAETVVAILAVLKAGGAYVPVDPGYPKHRIAFIVGDARPSFLLADREVKRDLTAEWTSHRPTIVRFDASDATSSLKAANLRSDVRPSDLACVMFTSGSSGRPKGVMLTHFGLFSYLNSLWRCLGVHQEDRFLHTASFSFSSSNRQLFLPLCGGSTVVMASAEEARNPLALFDLIKHHGVTVADIIPSFWRSCIDTLGALDNETRQVLLDNELRLLLSASEPLPRNIPIDWREMLNKDTRLVNMYGTTETTGIVATHEIPVDIRDDGCLGYVPIGQPIEAVRCHILDADLKPVLDGDEGELYVSGPTLARGYANDSDLTARAFIQCADKGLHSRFFRTHDICRRRAGGPIEYVGRSDDQMKIRGFRIEPREIEDVLDRHPAIRESIVLGVEINGEKRLVAYFVSVQGQRPSSSDLREFLRGHLAEYMIPARFVGLVAISRTPNGKVDRQALIRCLSNEDSSSNQPGNGALSPVEEKVVTICAEVLGLPSVSLHCGFYESGGNSLLALKVLAKLLDEFGVSLQPSVFLEAPTIAKLAAQVEVLKVKVT